MRLSQRVRAMAESATLAVDAKAAKLRAAGVDVISFAAGQPDFDTPDHIKAAAKQAIDDGRTGYPKPASGLAEAKSAVCAKLLRDNGLHYDPGQVIITVGGKNCFNLACQALLNDGDEVIIPVPYWVSYPEIVKLAGGRPVFVSGKEENGFRVQAGQISEALTERTRALVLNSPSNPGGFVYPRVEIAAIAEVVAGRDLLVFSDEMYDRLVYGDTTHASFAAAGAGAYARTLTMNGASKTYAMTGWRIGYAAGPEPLIKAMAKLQSQGTSGAATFVQIALAEALSADQDCVERMRVEFERRAAHMHRRLEALPGVRCARPHGAFYAFPDVSATYPRLDVSGSVGFAERLLGDARVAVVPGAAFGCDRHVRFSFAISMEQIDTGMDRLAALLT